MASAPHSVAATKSRAAIDHRPAQRSLVAIGLALVVGDLVLDAVAPVQPQQLVGLRRVTTDTFP